jgi:molybdate transport system substrate-binding protein
MEASMPLLSFALSSALRSSHRAAPLLALLTVIVPAASARADEIRLLSAAAMQTVYKEIIGDFERASGHRVVIHYGTIGAITDWTIGGEQADIIISSPPSFARIAQKVRIDAHNQIAICKVGAGVVVPSGPWVPRVDTIDDLRGALLAAKTIVYADPARGGAAGIHIARVIGWLGLTEQLKPKTRFGAGGDITEVTLTQGDKALGMTQVSEIVEKPGAEFVGPLPEELQNYTIFAAVTPGSEPPSPAAASLLTFLQGPVATAAIEKRGMQVCRPGADDRC